MKRERSSRSIFKRYWCRANRVTLITLHVNTLRHLRVASSTPIYRSLFNDLNILSLVIRPFSRCSEHSTRHCPGFRPFIEWENEGETLVYWTLCTSWRVSSSERAHGTTDISFSSQLLRITLMMMNRCSGFSRHSSSSSSSNEPDIIWLVEQLRLSVAPWRLNVVAPANQTFISFFLFLLHNNCVSD